MIHRIFALVLVLGVSACGTSNDARIPTPTEPASTPSSFIDIESFTTTHGHEVWLVSEPTIPIISISISWPDGHYYEADEVYGVSDTVAYMMNEGAGEMDSTAYATAMEEQNMDFGCSASAIWVTCSATFLKERMQPSIDLVKLALHEPRFDSGPIERKQREDIAGIEQRETNPSYLAGRAFADIYYPDHPLARQLERANVTAVDQDGIRKQYEQIFSRDGAKLTVVGAITRDELEPLLDEIFEPLAQSSDPSDSDTAIEDTSEPIEKIVYSETGQPEIVVKSLPQPQSLVQARGPGLSRDNPDFYAAVIANQIFGGSSTSRLFQSLRTEKGLTYGVYSNISQSVFQESWRVSGQVRNEMVGEFIDGIKEEMTELVEKGATAEELKAAKDYIIGSYPLGFDSNAKIARTLSSVQREGLNTDYFDKRNALFESVTLEDVNRVLTTYLKPERFTFVVVGEPSGLKPSSETPK